MAKLLDATGLIGLKKFEQAPKLIGTVQYIKRTDYRLRIYNFNNNNPL